MRFDLKYGRAWAYLAPVLGLVLAATLAACSSGGSSSPPATTTSSAPSSSAAATPAGGSSSTAASGGNSAAIAEIKTNWEAFFNSASAGRNLVLDLGNVKLVDRGAVRFLARHEARGTTLRNCPGYIREWILRERNGNSNQ